jgi:hypothetical protein
VVHQVRLGHLEHQQLVELVLHQEPMVLREHQLLVVQVEQALLLEHLVLVVLQVLVGQQEQQVRQDLVVHLVSLVDSYII